MVLAAGRLPARRALTDRPGPRRGLSTCTRVVSRKERPGFFFVSLYVHYAAPSPDSTAKVAALELSLLHQDGGAHLDRAPRGQTRLRRQGRPREEDAEPQQGRRLWRRRPDAGRRLGFVKDDAVVLRAEVEMAPA